MIDKTEKGVDHVKKLFFVALLLPVVASAQPRPRTDQDAIKLASDLRVGCSALAVTYDDVSAFLNQEDLDREQLDVLIGELQSIEEELPSIASVTSADHPALLELKRRMLTLVDDHEGLLEAVGDETHPVYQLACRRLIAMRSQISHGARVPSRSITNALNQLERLSEGGIASIEIDEEGQWRIRMSTEPRGNIVYQAGFFLGDMFLHSLGQQDIETLDGRLVHDPSEPELGGGWDRFFIVRISNVYDPERKTHIWVETGFEWVIPPN